MRAFVRLIVIHFFVPLVCTSSLRLCATPCDCSCGGCARPMQRDEWGENCAISGFYFIKCPERHDVGCFCQSNRINRVLHSIFATILLLVHFSFISVLCYLCITVCSFRAKLTDWHIYMSFAASELCNNADYNLPLSHQNHSYSK